LGYGTLFQKGLDGIGGCHNKDFIQNIVLLEFQNMNFLVVAFCLKIIIEDVDILNFN